MIAMNIKSVGKIFLVVGLVTLFCSLIAEGGFKVGGYIFSGGISLLILGVIFIFIGMKKKELK